MSAETLELARLLGETPDDVWMARTGEGKYLRGHFMLGDHWMLGFLSEWGCRRHSEALRSRRPSSGAYTPVRLSFDAAMDIVRSIAKRHEVSGLRVFDAEGNMAGEWWVS